MHLSLFWQRNKHKKLFPRFCHKLSSLLLPSGKPLPEKQKPELKGLDRRTTPAAAAAAAAAMADADWTHPGGHLATKLNQLSLRNDWNTFIQLHPPYLLVKERDTAADYHNDHNHNSTILSYLNPVPLTT